MLNFLYYTTLLLLFASIGFSFYLLKTKTPIRHKKRLRVTALSISIFLGFSLLFTADVFGLFRQSMKPDLRIKDYESIRAQMVGAYIAECLPGSKVLLFEGSLQGQNDATVQSRVAALKKGIDGKASLEAVEYIAPKTNKKGKRVLGLGAKEFCAKRDKHPDCDVIVTSIDLPRKIEDTGLWGEAFRGEIKLIVLNGNIRRFKEALLDGTITLATCQRPWWTYHPSIPDDLVKAFHQRYLLINAGNTEALHARYKHLFH